VWHVVWLIPDVPDGESLDGGSRKQGEGFDAYAWVEHAAYVHGLRRREDSG